MHDKPPPEFEQCSLDSFSVSITIALLYTYTQKDKHKHEIEKKKKRKTDLSMEHCGMPVIRDIVKVSVNGTRSQEDIDSSFPVYMGFQCRNLKFVSWFHIPYLSKSNLLCVMR